MLLTMGLVAAVAIPSYAKVREVAAETRVNTFPIPQAQVGNDWFREYEREITWAKGEAAAWRPLRLLRMADVSGRYLNVADGVRKAQHYLR